MTRLKVYLVTLVLMGSTLVQAQKNVLRKSVYFESGKFELTTESKTILSQLADSLKKFTSFTIAFRGNTDDVGDSLYNKKLSEQRVEAVKNFLTEQGVKPESFKIWALGESKPLADNTSEEGKRQNRRVDLAVTLIKRAEPAKVAVVKDTLPSIQELYRKLAVPPEEFCINPARDTMIRCRNGTFLKTRAGSFKLMPACSNQCVKFRVKESFSRSGMILDNLTTTSNGRVLESMGMMYTEAVDCNGKKVGLTSGKDILVVMPSDTLIPGAKLFYGERNAHDSLMNWKAADNARLLGITAKQMDTCRTCGGDSWGGRVKCRFFFCKIKRAIGPLFRKKSGRRIGRSRNRIRCSPICNNMKDMMKQYGVTNMNQLLDTLRKEREAKMERQLANGTISNEDLNYFVFNLPKLGWVNTDAFVDLSRKEQATLKVNFVPRNNTDCRLVFQKRKVALPPTNEANGVFEFGGIPKGEKVWVVALKYEGGEAFLCIKEVVIGNETVEVELKKVSIEELKQQMLQLDQ